MWVPTRGRVTRGQRAREATVATAPDANRPHGQSPMILARTLPKLTPGRPRSRPADEDRPSILRLLVLMSLGDPPGVPSTSKAPTPTTPKRPSLSVPKAAHLQRRTDAR